VYKGERTPGIQMVLALLTNGFLALVENAWEVLHAEHEGSITQSPGNVLSWKWHFCFLPKEEPTSDYLHKKDSWALLD
jgi:hypothetical protein